MTPANKRFNDAVLPALSEVVERIRTGRVDGLVLVWVERDTVGNCVQVTDFGNGLKLAAAAEAIGRNLADDCLEQSIAHRTNTQNEGNNNAH